MAVKADENFQIHGSLLSIVVDIVFVILENVVKHSGEDTPSASIEILQSERALTIG